MKNAIVLLLFLALLSQSFVKVSVGVYYAINKTYISQQLCENKDKPTLNCKGHCYLNKQLKKTEDDRSKQMQNVLKDKEEYTSKNTQHISVMHIPVYVATILSAGPLAFISLKSETDLLKPPIA